MEKSMAMCSQGKVDPSALKVFKCRQSLSAPHPSERWLSVPLQSA
jgi:hypothetical protein